MAESFSSPLLFPPLLFVSTNVLPGDDILGKCGSPSKPCCPDISEDIMLVGNTHKKCVLKYITLKQTYLSWGICPAGDSFLSQDRICEIWHVHIVLPLYFLFSLFKQEETGDISEGSFFSTSFTIQPPINTILSLVFSVDFWDNSFQAIVCLSSSRGSVSDG